MGKIGLLSAVFILFSFSKSVELEEIRINYNKAVEEKEVCKRMILALEKRKNNSAIHLAYLGGFQTLWAKHVLSPIRKMQTFNQGKENIEAACQKDPNSIEIRFIRLSVQKFAPSFLGYRSHIREDELFIRTYRHTLVSESVQKNIDRILKK